MLATTPIRAVLAPVADAARANGVSRQEAMDEPVFHSLYARTAPRLRAYLRSATGDEALADDLVQESYYRLLRSGFRGENDRHRTNYLYRIATNLVRDWYRRRGRETELEHEPCSRDALAPRVEMRSDVGRALERLGRRDRQMLWLAYVEGCSHREIATVLGLRAASIRSMLFRARQRMADALRLQGLAPEEGG